MDHFFFLIFDRECMILSEDSNLSVSATIGQNIAKIQRSYVTLSLIEKNLLWKNVLANKKKIAHLINP